MKSESHLLVMWIGDMYAPSLFLVPIENLDIEKTEIDLSKIYCISDLVKEDLEKINSIEKVTNTPSNVPTKLIFTPKYSKLSESFPKNTIDAATKLSTSLYEATYLLNSYVEAVEEAVYSSFSTEFLNNIVHLEITKLTYTIVISYNAPQGIVFIYFIKKQDNKLYNETDTNSIGEIYYSVKVPQNINGISALEEYIRDKIKVNGLIVPSKIIFRVVNALSLCNDYLNTIDSTDFPQNVKTATKLAAIRQIVYPKIILNP